MNVGRPMVGVLKYVLIYLDHSNVSAMMGMIWVKMGNPVLVNNFVIIFLIKISFQLSLKTPLVVMKWGFLFTCQSVQYY